MFVWNCESAVSVADSFAIIGELKGLRGRETNA
jgi:hypothetical protein